MTIRKADVEDIPQIINVEKRAWPLGGAANEEQFISRINIFPEGVLVAEEKGVIVGVLVGEVINSSTLREEKLTWDIVTDFGYLRKSHTPKGDSLYGVDLSVDPDFQQRGIGRQLLQEIGKMAIRKNLHYGFLGARMPDYHKYADRYSPEEYIKAKGEDGELLDSELRFYKKSGISLVRAVKNYFPDEDSKDYGVIGVWKNPFYVKNAFMGRIIGWLGAQLFKI